MAEIRCPNCGKNNPDILDVCQFCQTPLKSDSVLKIGQTPTKKNTGELESALPNWLRDVRQQARDSAEADAQAAAQSQPPKEEPPDLLAGLASQASNTDDEEVPDWLASLNPTAKSKPTASTTSTPTNSPDFFAQSNPSEVTPEPAAESPSWMDNLRDESPTPVEKDDLSDWFTKASEGPEETVELDSDSQPSEFGWPGSFGPLSSPEQPAPKEEEDLSWLHNLEAAAKQTGDLQTPKQGTDWQANFDIPSAASQPSPQDDLSWLDSLGGIDESSPEFPGQPAAPQNDLSWLDQLGQSSEPSQPSQPAAPQEDLSWLHNLGASEPPSPAIEPNPLTSSAPFASEEDWRGLNKLGETPETAQPSSVPGAGVEIPPAQPPASEDLSWLKDLGTPAESSQPSTTPEDLSWLQALGQESDQLSAPPFTQAASPRQTAPLGQRAEENAPAEPDWLKSAIEPPSMPAPGDLSMDWFSGSQQPADEKPAPAAPQPGPLESDLFSTPSEPASLSNRDVDSLFSIEMPDWLSQSEPEASESAPQQTPGPSANSDQSLAPVDLPSWVQAMRPVEAVISETTPSVADQPTETEGPLAGLQGVLPIAPIGSSKKPKPVPLKLQVSDEQQAGVGLLEEILESETNPRTLITSPFVAPQQWLRWALTGLFLIVLSVVIFFHSQSMSIPASLPVQVGNLSNAIINIPVNSKVLVVVDYEPSLAGEMEAISSPLLNQIVRLSQPNFSFISTSPNGAALIERLIGNLSVNQVASQYHNLGYLPGGATGVLGFMESPNAVNPLADVQSFSEYSAFIVLSDHAESGRMWVEQFQSQRQVDLTLANKPLLMIASAQAGPLLEPYVLSGQIAGMISGISDAARYESANNSQPGIVRSYWDTFGIGLMMSIVLIVVGSLWSLFTRLRARRVATE